MQKTSKLKRLARQLLTTSCLTAATGVLAVAGTFAVPNGTPGTESSPNQVPTSDTIVTGCLGGSNICGTSSTSTEWVEFQGLPSLTTFNITGANLVSFFDSFTAIQDNSPTFTILSGPTNNSGTGSIVLGGVVPSDGNVIVEIQAQNENSGSYQLTLNSPVGTPEPGTLGGVALGLAGLGMLARRRKKA